MARRLGEAALLALCLALIVTLYAVLQEVADPNDRSVAVLRAETGCVLILHRIRHELPREQCRNIARALLQMSMDRP